MLPSSRFSFASLRSTASGVSVSLVDGVSSSLDDRGLQPHSLRSSVAAVDSEQKAGLHSSSRLRSPQSTTSLRKKKPRAA